MPLNPNTIDRRGLEPMADSEGRHVTMFPQGGTPEPEQGEAPDEITDLSTPNPGISIAQMTWTPIMNADRIEVWRRNDDSGSSFSRVASAVEALTSSYPLSLLAPSTTYSAYLVAVNEFGETQSNTVQFTTKSLLGL